MDISDIYRILPRRYTDTLDRLADSYLPDIPATGNRLADATERIATYLGATVHPTGDRTLDALDAIVSVIVDGKEHQTEDLEDIQTIMETEDKFVAVMSEDINVGAMGVALNVPDGKKVTLDMNGHTLKGTKILLQIDGGEAVVRNGKVDGVGRSVVVRNGGKLVLEDAQIVSTGDVAVSCDGVGTSFTMNSGRIDAQEFGVLVTNTAEFVMNGGYIEGYDNCAIGGNGSPGQGETVMTINGGTLIGHIQTAGYIACGIYSPNIGVVNFNGGEIISDGCGICMRGGQVNLNGGKITAKGASGVLGKVGDSRIVVGPCAVVYDETAKYPAVASMELNIAKGALLHGTDGDLQVLLSAGAEANINDLR